MRGKVSPPRRRRSKEAVRTYSVLQGVLEESGYCGFWDGWLGEADTAGQFECCVDPGLAEVVQDRKG